MGVGDAGLNFDKIEIKNAIIESAYLGIEENGILTIRIGLNYGGAGQSFTGYALQLPKSFKNYKEDGPAGHHIMRILEVADVDSWSKLVGKTVRAKTSWNCCYAIGHIIKDDWFEPNKPDEE